MSFILDVDAGILQFGVGSLQLEVGLENRRRLQADLGIKSLLAVVGGLGSGGELVQVSSMAGHS